MFEFKVELEERLSTAIKAVVEELDCPMAFGHFCWGELSQPGGMRLTKVMINERKPGLLRNNTHDAFFTKHINKVSRKRLFLDFLTLHFFNRQFFDSDDEIIKNFYCVIEGQGGVHADSEQTISLNNNGSVLKIPRHLSDILVGERFKKDFGASLLEDYVRIYADADDNNSSTSNSMAYSIERLIACKHKFFDQIKFVESSRKSWEVVSQLGLVYAPESQSDSAKDSDLDSLDFIGALQTALLYVYAGCPGVYEDMGFISHGISYPLLSENSAIDNPMIILSLVLDDFENQEAAIDILMKQAKPVLNKIAKIGSIRRPETISSFAGQDELKTVLPRIKPTLIDSTINRHIVNDLHVKIFPEWARQLLLWNTLLIESLRDSIHEGQNLSFTFVIADPVSVEDSGIFEVIPLFFEEDAYEGYQPWKNDKSFLFEFLVGQTDQTEETKKTDETPFQKFLKRVVRNIEKKNYSWFTKGSYALLWDSTFPSQVPHSLIRVKDSSWDVIINDILVGRQSDIYRSVSLAIAFARSDSSGGLSFNGKLVASFRKGLPWSYENQREDNRSKNLREALSTALVDWPLENPSVELENLKSRLFDGILAVSEDPSKGCMLIIGKTVDEIFDNMGVPWKLGKALYETSVANVSGKRGSRPARLDRYIDPNALAVDELASLMAMDGATCLALKGNRAAISFRNSVMRTKGSRNIEDAKKELDGDGSRKWSGLIAASQTEVDLVVAVSQDGPIIIFSPDKNGKVSYIKL